MRATLAILLIAAGSTATAAGFDKVGAVQDCQRQWGGLQPLFDSCVKNLEDQSAMLNEFKVKLDPARVSATELRNCEENHGVRYLDQLRCLEDANACHYRDSHGNDPIEEYCP